MPTSLLHYGITLLSVALAVALTLLLKPFLEPATLSLFYAAVIFSSWYGGMKAGLLATVLSTITINYFLIPPFYSLVTVSLGSVLPLGVFVFLTVAISSLISALRVAKQRANQNWQNLRASERRYRILAENVPQLVWMTREDGYVEFFNQRWYDTTGLTLEQSLGWEWQQVIHPEDLPTVLENWRRALSTADKIEVQHRIRQSDRTYHWYVTQALPLRDDKGEITNWFGSCTDIHDQKQAEAAVFQKEQEFRTIAENSPDIIARIDREFRHVYVNPAIVEATGLSPEDFIGKTHTDLGFPAEICASWREKLENCFATGKPIFVEFDFPSPDGIRSYQSRVVPEFAADGTVETVLGITRDVTDFRRVEQALRHSELRFRRVFESNMLAICFWNLDGNITEANDAFLQLVGYQREEMLAGKLPLRNVTAAKYKPLDERAIEEMLVSGVCTPYEKEYIHKNGNSIPLLIGGALLEESGFDGVAFAIDLSDRKRAEEALRESEERFRQLVENLQAVFWMSNPTEGQLLYISPAYEKVWGRTCESLYSNYLEWLEGIHPDDRERVRNALVNQASQGKYEAEYRVVRPDSSIRWVRDRGVPIKVESGKVYQTAGIAEDITEQKQAEEALREALPRLNSHVENSPVAVIEWSSDWRITRWSRAAEKLFGWQAEEVLGKHFNDWRFVFEEDMEAVADVCRRIFSANEPQIFSYNRNYTKDDSIVYCEWYSSMLTDESGKVVSVLSLALDVTDRKKTEQELQQSEAKFRLMADSAPVFIWMSGTDGHCSYFNQPWLDFTKQTLEEAIARGWIKDVHPEDFHYCVDTYLNAFNARLPFEVEYRHQQPDGEYRWILDKGVPLFASDGTFSGYIGSGIDITDRKQIEAELEDLLIREQTARAASEAANRIKDEFLAVLSHELRSPLNPILGWAKLLRSRKFDEEKTNFALETIERNARLQTQLIEDLLDVSRILQGKLSVNIGSVDLVSTIQAALETVRLAAEAKSIQIQTVFEFSNSRVAGDTNRLQQVFWNLLSNAVKFTSGGGRVDVRLQYFDCYAQIQVSDTGKGISPDFLPYVFDYFRQADSTTTRQFGGLGLGLAIVRHLVELHGGTVQADSPGEGQGATFTVKLPLKMPSLETKQTDESPKCSADLQGVRILIVDDDADTRDYLVFILEECGAEVTAVSSALEALQTFTKLKPDVLLSDIGMPEIDGYMLISQVRTLPAEEGGKVPAIALTAYAGEVNQQQALKAGFQTHLPKPIEPDELVRAIAKLRSYNKS